MRLVGYSFVGVFTREEENLATVESATDPSKVTLTSATTATITVEQEQGGRQCEADEKDGGATGHGGLQGTRGVRSP